ncbi:MAG: alanine racemase [Acidobacteria bacterium]|nr:alanine racemase [Acidobacteriota bacterium]
MVRLREDASRRFRPTRVELDASALSHNIARMRNRLPPGSRLVVVVKANAYGHGAIETARVAEREGVAMLAVAILEEAIILREAEIRLPILCFGPIGIDGTREAVDRDITPGITGLENLNAVASAASSLGKSVGVHLKLDSGMGRMGLVDEDLEPAAALILDTESVRVEGIYTHFSNASTPEDPLNEEQQRRFGEMVAKLAKLGIEAPLHHTANSAAAEAGLVRDGDWARCGIALYGGNPMDDNREMDLLPVMRWITAIARVKWLDEGEVVGYGKAYVTSRRTRVATLPVGYADGYHRALSGRSRVLVHGQSAPVIGRVSMDLITIDVTDIEGATTGDEVVLLGRQGDAVITAEELAGLAGTINYEIFTSVSSRVPRVWNLPR